MADRVLLVHDGTAWFLRHVRLIIEEDMMRSEMVYKCDKHLGGPFADLDDAVRFMKSHLAGCVCKLRSPIESSAHEKGCALRFAR